MQFDKQQILDFLRQQGKDDQVGQADSELPDQVDTDRDAGLLSKFGIDVPSLLSRFGGGSGGIGGLLGG